MDCAKPVLRESTMSTNKLPHLREMIPDAFPYVEPIHSVEHSRILFASNQHDISRQEPIVFTYDRYPANVYAPSTASYLNKQNGSPTAQNLFQNLFQNSYISQCNQSSVLSTGHSSFIHGNKVAKTKGGGKNLVVNEKRRRDHCTFHINCGDKIRDIINVHTPRPSCSYCSRPKNSFSKNQTTKLEESVMSDFRTALHMSTDTVYVIMKEVACLAQHLYREKQKGLMEPNNNLFNWSEDVRSQVAARLLSLMKRDCLSHGIELHEGDYSELPARAPI